MILELLAAILSIEIMALTIASVAEAPIVTQAGVLVLIGLIATFAVYGIVSVILRMVKPHPQ
jgi:predicted DNA repair protein MutK